MEKGDPTGTREKKVGVAMAAVVATFAVAVAVTPWWAIPEAVLTVLEWSIRGFFLVVAAFFAWAGWSLWMELRGRGLEAELETPRDTGGGAWPAGNGTQD